MPPSSAPPFSVEALSIEQKAALCSGASMSSTKAVGEVPSVTLTDGPHGLRKPDGANYLPGLGTSVAATCFPPAVGIGQSWDIELIRRVGAALGRECRAAQVNVLLAGALLGQGGGRALAEVLYGIVNPSGRLTETVPDRIEDTPAYFDFPGENRHVTYGEGLLVGYRWYDTRNVAVTFPFGHGLSYTTFGYSDLAVEAGPDGITANVTVTNTGDRGGREVVQFYCALPGSRVRRPLRELKGFAGVTLEPGESRSVTALLRRKDLAYWDIRVDGWFVEGGEYLVSAGPSSRNLPLSARVRVAGDPVSEPLSMESTIGELLAHPVAGSAVATWFQSQPGDPGAASAALGADALQLAASIPLRQALNFVGNAIAESQLRQLIEIANAAASQDPPTDP